MPQIHTFAGPAALVGVDRTALEEAPAVCCEGEAAARFNCSYLMGEDAELSGSNIPGFARGSAWHTCKHTIGQGAVSCTDSCTA